MAAGANTALTFSKQTEALLDRADAICAERGARLTDLRRQVLGLILQEEAPTGAYDLLDRLRATRTLLSDVQSLLRLTLDGDEAAFDEARAPEGQRRLIAATEDAADLIALKARIAREATAARAIYERIVEAPARAAGWKPRVESKGSGR